MTWSVWDKQHGIFSSVRKTSPSELILENDWSLRKWIFGEKKDCLMPRLYVLLRLTKVYSCSTTHIIRAELLLRFMQYFRNAPWGLCSIYRGSVCIYLMNCILFAHPCACSCSVSSLVLLGASLGLDGGGVSQSMNLVWHNSIKMQVLRLFIKISPLLFYFLFMLKR